MAAPFFAPAIGSALAERSPSAHPAVFKVRRSASCALRHVEPLPACTAALQYSVPRGTSGEEEMISNIDQQHMETGYGPRRRGRIALSVASAEARNVRKAAPVRGAVASDHYVYQPSLRGSYNYAGPRNGGLYVRRAQWPLQLQSEFKLTMSVGEQEEAASLPPLIFVSEAIAANTSVARGFAASRLRRRRSPGYHRCA